MYIRYCKICEDNTLHDKLDKDTHTKLELWERLLLGVITLGVH